MAAEKDITFSDDEADLGPGGPAYHWAKHTLRFGKHKGSTLRQMICSKAGRDYLRYLLKWDQLRPATKEGIEHALDFYDEQKASRHKDSHPDIGQPLKKFVDDEQDEVSRAGSEHSDASVNTPPPSPRKRRKRRKKTVVS